LNLKKAFKDKAEVKPEAENVKKHLIIALTSDRGLCGAIHTSIVKAVKVMLNEKKEGFVGKKNITFLDASSIANEILASNYEFDSGEILYNRFKYFNFYFFEVNPSNFQGINCKLCLYSL